MGEWRGEHLPSTGGYHAARDVPCACLLYTPLYSARLSKNMPPPRCALPVTTLSCSFQPPVDRFLSPPPPLPERSFVSFVSIECVHSQYHECLTQWSAAFVLFLLCGARLPSVTRRRCMLCVLCVAFGGRNRTGFKIGIRCGTTRPGSASEH